MSGTITLTKPEFGRRRDDVLDLQEANAARARSLSLKRLSVLVPMYNQCWTVGPMLERLLSTPTSLDLEVVVVDDGSTDSGAQAVADVAQRDSRVRLIRLPSRQGKGAAIRRGIEEMTGDVAIVQDAELEYDPHEIPRLLKPILSGQAEAVFGSRFAGAERRVMRFWRALGNRALTIWSNAVCNLNLSDMETCYKAIRSDILRQLRLTADGFDIEPEITCRLAQWGARIYEAPVSFHGSSATTGVADGLKAMWRTLWCKLWDNRFTDHTGMYVLRSCDRAKRYNQWLLRHVQPMLGQRLLEAGSGIGNLSQMLADRPRLVLIDHDPLYVELLRDRFAGRGNVRVLQTDLTEEGFEHEWSDESLDTILCSNVLEHLEPHEEVLAGFHRALSPQGHCVIIVPAEPALYCGLDQSLGHYRRYTRESLEQAMRSAGFDVVSCDQVCKLGAVAWLINGRLLGRRNLTPRQMLWFDSLWPVMQAIDRWLPWRGMSLVVVGRKPSL